MKKLLLSIAFLAASLNVIPAIEAPQPEAPTQEFESTEIKKPSRFSRVKAFFKKHATKENIMMVAVALYVGYVIYQKSKVQTSESFDSASAPTNEPAPQFTTFTPDPFVDFNGEDPFEAGRAFGVDPFNTTKREVIKIYRELAAIYHPDRNPDNIESATKAFANISAAYETLKKTANS